MDAEQVYRRILAKQPESFDALHMLGVVLTQLGRLDEAAQRIAQALQINSTTALAHYNYGNTLQNLKRHADALTSYERSLALRADYAPAWNRRGMALKECGRLADAVASYERALTLRPNHAESWFNRGNALRELMSDEEALVSYERALEIQPTYAVAWNNRGIVLGRLLRHTEALESHERALASAPDLFEAWFNRGNALRELGRHEEAVSSYDQALALSPGFADAWINRAATLTDMRRWLDALASYQRALAIRPELSSAAASCFDIASRCCMWTEAARYRELAMAHLSADRPIAPFIAMTMVDSPEAHLRAARTYVAQKHPAIVPQIRAFDSSKHERIRIAYVSADFHAHATAYLMAGLFELHDRSRFEVFGISLNPSDGSPIRSRLEAAFEHFIDAANRSDDAVAEMLRDLEIDIAVDLKGFTRGCRPGIFARRPAPITASYLGYPGTMGAEYIDYLIADSWVIPPSERHWYSEKVVYLPDCYQVNDSRRVIASTRPTRSELGLPESGFVFCCFNNSTKITPELFGAWMRLLCAAPHSVLWLYEDNEIARDNLIRESHARGIDSKRLIFARHVDPDQHLARIRAADLVLDTLPYNAHTTASDALWAGVPVLTCSGSSFPARVAGSLLRSVGLADLITSSLAEYEALALKLASDCAFRSAIRSRLAINRSTSPLFDTNRFRRHIEAAYQSMHERHTRGE